MNSATALKRIYCLVTRPAHQVDNLKQMLETSGFIPIIFPTIVINEPPATGHLKNLKETIQHYDIALFVSRNAVDFAFRHIDASTIPVGMQLGVIGKGTLQALQKYGADSHAIPANQFNSEGLLATDALQDVKNRRVIIFRGQEGRNLLGDTLRDRGAEVEYCEVYRRELPAVDTHEFADKTAAGFPAVAIFTSSEGMKNCFELISAEQAERMRNITWLLISERMRETASNLGHNGHIIIASSASDEGIVQTLEQWQQSLV